MEGREYARRGATVILLRAMSFHENKTGGLLKEVACFCKERLPGSRPEAVSGFAHEQAGETYALVTFSACGPFGPCVTSNSTS
jgi:hypothetical protein